MNTENTYLPKYLTARHIFKLPFDFVNNQCCQMIGQIATKIPKYCHFCRHSSFRQKSPRLATLSMIHSNHNKESGAKFKSTFIYLGDVLSLDDLFIFCSYR